jgi:hypothetical protein
MLVSVLKMAIVFEEYTIEEQRSIVCLLWAKGLNSKDIHKEMFPVYGGKCLSRKGGSQLGGKRFADDEEVETKVWKWPRQQSKDFCAAGFDALVARWDKCSRVGGGHVEK